MPEARLTLAVHERTPEDELTCIIMEALLHTAINDQAQRLRRARHIGSPLPADMDSIVVMHSHHPR